MERCPISDLPKDMCAHCRGDADVVDLTHDFQLEAVFRSKYNSVCAIDSEHRIVKGDEISRVVQKDNPFGEPGYACRDCTKRLVKRRSMQQ